MENKKIYIVATPIGNLKDITLRALETLKQVDFIAAEDTRVSIKLLNHFNIKTKMISYHKFNESQSSKKIIELVKSGNNVALISDAGMPLISDPGSFLIEQARNSNIEVEVIPGPSAFVSAFALSGFSAPMTFIGFLKDKSAQRQKQITNLIEGTYVFYVAPHKLKSTLEDFEKFITKYEHQIFLAKELTKKFETHYYGTSSQIIAQLPEVIKGEYTLCLSLKEIKNQKTNKYAKFSKIKEMEL